MNPIKLDRRRQYYIVLDTETATLPHSMDFDGEARKRIAIAKPLVYDLAWSIIDRTGKIYASRSFLISEIFSVPSIFNTAYYASKRPKYLEKLRNKEITLTSWNEAVETLCMDMEIVSAIGGYNSMFDFIKAITFTEEYISNLYSENYYEWEKEQNRRIDYIVENTQKFSRGKNCKFFTLRDKQLPLFDIWGLSCKHLLNNDDFRSFCSDNGAYTASRKYYSTTAENAYRFIFQDKTFEESHTALEDVSIESALLAEVFKKVKPQNAEMGIIFFPFRLIGRADI